MVILAVILVGCLQSLLGGGTLMLTVDVIHNHWVPQVPTVGYWWSVLIFIGAWLFRSLLMHKTEVGNR